ncbi:hypothetical protein F4803DRAFT_517982 [Xylaria telfairii]|nr:hypothetical protein F4803DRAFT_517982 [Xylaria telfairii]
MQFSTFFLAALSMSSTIANPLYTTGNSGEKKNPTNNGGYPTGNDGHYNTGNTGGNYNTGNTGGNYNTGNTGGNYNTGNPGKSTTAVSVEFNTAATAFVAAEKIVQAQQAKISSFCKGEITAEVIVEIRESLLLISQTVHGLFGPVLALNVDAYVALSTAQLNSVPAFSKSFLAIFVEIEAIGKLVTSLNKDQLAKLQPELQLVLSPCVSLARPVLAYIKVAAPIYVDAFKGVAQVLINIKAILKVCLEVKLGVHIGLGLFI